MAMKLSTSEYSLINCERRSSQTLQTPAYLLTEPSTGYRLVVPPRPAVPPELSTRQRPEHQENCKSILMSFLLSASYDSLRSLRTRGFSKLAKVLIVDDD